MDDIRTQESRVVKSFVYKDRRCVIIKIDRSEILRSSLLEPSTSSIFEPYHNGYVELKEKEIKEDYDEYNIRFDEITYQGDLKFKGLDASDGKWYIGFDTTHHWNHLHPESKTAKHVETVCRRIVDELEQQSKGK